MKLGCLLTALGMGFIAQAQNPPAVLTSCGGYVKWANLTVTPAAPQAGDTVYINGTGLTQAPCSGGVGAINAYLFGADMFTAPINTCGLNQQINILDQAEATFDALVCPANANQLVKLGLVVPIPSFASGIGQLNITLTANDTSTASGGRMVYCFDAVITL